MAQELEPAAGLLLDEGQGPLHGFGDAEGEGSVAGRIRLEGHHREVQGIGHRRGKEQWVNGVGAGHQRDQHRRGAE